MPGDSGGPILNDLCEKLAARLHRAIIDAFPQPFHVYIVLPVHPEGLLNSGPTMTQIHWTMQSLVFGSGSLLARVKDSLRVAGKPESDWTKYLTLLNLRNWALLSDGNGNSSLVTEQIYVHTKLMIVDDRYVIHGSANINDRSLLGRRDSELAVLIHDSQEGLADLCGNGKQLLTLNHACNLRKAIWRKLFGLDLKASSAVGGAGPASELQSALDHPAAPATVVAIQAIADANKSAYESVFPWIPRDAILLPGGRSETAASIWPLWNKETGKLDGAMPFEESFWAKAQATASDVGKLKSVRGFIVSLPIEWTMKENNNVGYHVRLVAKNDVPAASPGGNQLPEQAARDADASDTTTTGEG